MKKRFVILMVCLGIAALCMSGCSEETDRSSPVSVGQNEHAGGEKLNIGIDTLKEIGDGLYYDVNTNIVYWWNGIFFGYPSTTPTPYYASNGLPYKYNPETNVLEEILWGDGQGKGSED